MRWKTSRFLIDLRRPQVMGIVNLTADSFSDGGQCLRPKAALRHGEKLLREGAALLDLGAESSRPGASGVPADEEWHRLEPVLREVRTWGVPISVDTCKPWVMDRALQMGADVINDIHALRAPGAAELLARYPAAGVCLMHMRGDALSMQNLTRYDDVVCDVRQFLADRVRVLQDCGVERDRLVVDPGFGFAKTAPQNCVLAQRMGEFECLGLPLVVGWSRKSTLGWLTGRGVEQRLAASLAAALAAVQAGASVLRVHDVAATVDALRTWSALTPMQGQCSLVSNTGFSQ